MQILIRTTIVIKYVKKEELIRRGKKLQKGQDSGARARSFEAMNNWDVMLTELLLICLAALQ